MLFDDLNLIAGAFFNLASQVFNVYTTSRLLSGVLALWLLRKAVIIFRHI